MEETKNNRYYETNNMLYSMLKNGLKGGSKEREIMDKLILVNIGLLKKIQANTPYKRFTTCEAEDVEQILYTSYIELIQKAVEDGEEEYPTNVYAPLSKLLLKKLNDQYSNAGVFIPYSTQKLRQRKDYDSSVVHTTEFNPEIGCEGEAQDVSEVVMNNDLLSRFFSSLNQEEVTIFKLRYEKGLTFTQISPEAPDKARYIHNKALARFREQQAIA